MRAVTIVDGALEVREHPDPRPGGGEVLVRVRAAGLNGADMIQVRGKYPAPPGSPQDIPGLELAGEVVECGSSALRFAVGSRVMGIVGGGGQAELAVVHERQLMPVPDALDWPQAGGFPETFTTAHDALFSQAGLRPGERLLVSGAAGGVGVAAVQVAHRAGATVTATVRSQRRRQQVRELGADLVVAPDDFAGPFDVVLELVGAPNLGPDLRSLATGGRLVVIGVGAGTVAEVDLLVMMARRARLIVTSLRARPLEEKARCARLLEAEVLPMVDRGQVTVPIAATFPMDEAAAAYDRFRAGDKLGKVVLTIP